MCVCVCVCFFNGPRWMLPQNPNPPAPNGPNDPLIVDDEPLPKKARVNEN